MHTSVVFSCVMDGALGTVAVVLLLFSSPNIVFGGLMVLVDVKVIRPAAAVPSLTCSDSSSYKTL